MTIAITGATGFVGRVVMPLLMGEGHCVRALVRGGFPSAAKGTNEEERGEAAPTKFSEAAWAGIGRPDAEGARGVMGGLDAEAARGAVGGLGAGAAVSVETVTGHLLQPEKLAELVRGADVVIHLAAAITVSDTFDAEAYRINSEGTRLLLAAARAAGVRRFVQVSSVVVFEQAPYDEVLNEDRALAVESAYDYERSKGTAHMLALEHNAPGFEVVVLAPTAVIGPYDWRPSRIGEMVINLCRGRIPAIFPGGIDFVDVRDVAAALAAACRQGQAGKVYLLSGGWRSLAELRDGVGAVKGGKVWAPELPLWLVRGAVPVVNVFSAVTGRLRKSRGSGFVRRTDISRLAGMRFFPSGAFLTNFNRAAIDKLVYSNRHVDSSRARAELGFVSRPFAETLRDTVDWFRQEGTIK